jgi:hypothetical protein
MAVDDVYEIIVKGTCAGQGILNVFHFIDHAGTGDLADWVDHWENTGAPDVDTEYTGVLCNDWNPSEYLLTKVSPLPRGPQFSISADMPSGARLSSLALPTAAVIKWLTASGGRSGRGRTYLGPLGNQNSADGLLDATYQAFVQAFVDAMKRVFCAAGADYDGHWEFCVYSRLLDLAQPVLDGVVRAELKTQRRRQIGVGM